MTSIEASNEQVIKPAAKQESAIWLFIRPALVLLILLSVVDAAFFQVEMVVTGGFLPIRPTWATWLIVAVGALFVFRRRAARNPLLFGSMVLFFYCIVDSIYFAASQHMGLDEIHGALEYMAPIILLGVVGSLGLNVRSRDIFIPLVIFLVPCFIISAAQFVTNAPIVYPASLDGAFFVASVQGEGVPRAFSLFVSGLQAGIFYCFTGAVGTALALTKRARLPGLILLVVSAVGCYASLTRLMLIAFAFTVPATYLIRKANRFRITTWLPLGALGVGFLTIIQTFLVSNGFGRSDLANTYSMALRLDEWAYYWHIFVSGSISQIFFGQGIGRYNPGDDALVRANAAPIPIDNAFILILLGCGLIGLTIVIFCCVRAWIFLYRRAVKSNSPLRTASAGFFSSLPLIALIGDPPNAMLLLVMLSLMLSESC